MTTIITLIKKLIAQISFTLFSLKKRMLEFINIRINRKHKIYKVIMTSSSTSSKIAIVAAFPRGNLLDSICRLVDRLRFNGYHVIVIMNEGSSKSKDWIDELSNRDLTIICRPNIGRDFGAYQAGIRYVHNLPIYSNLERILFANDSVYYFPDSENFLDNILNVDGNWIAMFVNFQQSIHAQSFFQIFNRELFTNNAFLDFWSNYYPTNFRHRVINNGELKLAGLLIEAGFFPKPFVTAELIESSDQSHLVNREEKFALWSNFGSMIPGLLAASEEDHNLQFRRVFTRLNPTHHVGIVSTRVLKAPLKLDLLRTGLVSLSGLRDVAKGAGLTGLELENFTAEMSSKGSDASFSGFHKLWREFGYE